MPSITTYLHKLFSKRGEDRRREARHTVRLAASVTLISAAPESRSFKGHTCNISTYGLSLIISGITPDDAVKLSQNSNLLILVSLPTKIIKMVATTTYCRIFDEKKPEQGFFIGAQITEMSEDERNFYDAYLEQCTGK